MDMNQIQELRNTLLDIMDEVHRVCVENHVDYYIIGGTALGAIRHKGFIPWDTDIDIAMKRPDYDRFMKICNQKLAKCFFCSHYENTAGWYHPHALVFKKGTMIHWNREYYRKKKDIPVYIDIFPLDRCPVEEEKKREQEKKVRKKLFLQSRRECILYQRNSWMVRMTKRIVSALLHIQSNKSFNHSLDQEMKHYSDYVSSEICSMASHYSYSKQCMEESIYGKPVLYAFENRAYYGPEQITVYLQKLFGDYMELPPVEKRTEYMDYIGKIDF